MKNYLITCIIIKITVMSLFGQNSIPKRWEYPYIRSDTVINYYFSKKIIDPFRNIENIKNDSVEQWLNLENKFYDTIIHNIDNFKTIDSELKALENKRKNWTDWLKPVGSRIYYVTGTYGDNEIEKLNYKDKFSKNSVEIYCTKDINEQNKCEYNFNYFEPSLDNKYVAFGISPNGSELANIYIVEVSTGKLLPEKIRSRFGFVQWLPGNNGFFYTQEKDTLTKEDRKTPFEDSKVMLHLLNSEPNKDKEIVSRNLIPNLNLEKNEFLTLYIYPSSENVLLEVGSSYCRYYYAKLTDVLDKPSQTIKWQEIIGKDEKIKYSVLYKNKYFGLSYKENPNGKLILVNLPDTTKKKIFEAKDFVLNEIIINSHSIYASAYEKGNSRLIKIDPENYSVKYINLPFSGGMVLPSFNSSIVYQPSDSLLFLLNGYTRQTNGYILDKNDNITDAGIFQMVQYTEKPLNLIVEEIEVPSHDSTLVPLTIVYKKELKFDGTNPTIIEAYGAYGVSEVPEFRKNRILWFERGGVFALAHVRGGSEKGDKWYKGGYKSTKANSWKDLIACSEYMIKKKYTSPEKLAIKGVSAGGITIGRALTERPELFKVAIIFAGVLNPVRLDNSFNPGTVEFGTTKDSLEFGYLFTMDTYLHIKEGIKYPSILFTAGFNDARVDVWQPAKTAARFQSQSGSDNIILLRVQGKGHFDYPSDAEVYSFLFWQLGHPDFKLKELPGLYRNITK